MNFPMFQQIVKEFVEEYKIEAPVSMRLLDLTSEVGELSKEALKGSRYGRSAFEPTSNWDREMGDVFFALICLANSTDVNLELVLQQVLHKYERRLVQKGNAGS